MYGAFGKWGAPKLSAACEGSLTTGRAAPGAMNCGLAEYTDAAGEMTVLLAMDDRRLMPAILGLWLLPPPYMLVRRLP